MQEDGTAAAFERTDDNSALLAAPEAIARTAVIGVFASRDTADAAARALPPRLDRCCVLSKSPGPAGQTTSIGCVGRMQGDQRSRPCELWRRNNDPATGGSGNDLIRRQVGQYFREGRTIVIVHSESAEEQRIAARSLLRSSCDVLLTQSGEWKLD